MIASRAGCVFLFTLLGLGLAAMPTKDPKGAARATTRAPAKEADALGYGAAFDAELKKVGQISPAEFARRYAPRAEYLAGLTWDPTAAKFWDRFSLDPAKVQPHKRLGPPFRAPDFRLNDQELAAFRRNGFVVSERLGGPNFGEIFYRVYSRDLPVFISSDALLHAWHRSYDALLEEVEECYLIPALDDILAGMAARVTEARRRYGDGVLADSLSDADYVLAVGRSLLAGKPVPSALGQDGRVADTLKACDSLRLTGFSLFGRTRLVDFTQFKPRGRYEGRDLTRRYFRAMMWCGRIDLRVAGKPDDSSPRELGGAIVLHDLLRRAGKVGAWRQFDRVLQTFVGRTDSMTFGQLDGLLAAARIATPADVKDLRALEALQAKVLAGELGDQQIRGDTYVVPPFGSEAAVLPRSFTVLGQKFVLDSWATANVVFDDIIWDDDKVHRRIPSSLDVAFAVFANDHAVPELAARMSRRDGRRLRDGLNYQHNLAAARNVVDAQRPAAWTENIYMGWLACLRELSRPTTAARHPEALRTRAWAMKALNTQLASWAQLRHDTVLYAKQSYTGVPTCYYPAGYVEPVPEFWAALERLAVRSAECIEATPLPDRTAEEMGWTQTPGQAPRYGKVRVVHRGKDLQARQAGFLRNFARRVAVLREIATRELAQRPLSKEQSRFIEDTIQLARASGFAGYNGWYPELFYRGGRDAEKWDAVVADVHTDPPDRQITGDPGCVLHEGVGNVDLLLIAVDSGKDRVVYAGPLLSHYEFETPGVARKSDAEWRDDLRQGKAPPRPEWTRDYLVPGPNPDAGRYTHPDDTPAHRSPLGR
jgi:hypothetical protein